MAASTSHSSNTESVNGDTIEVKREPSQSGQTEDEIDSIRVAAIEDEPTSSASNSPRRPPANIKTSRSSSSSSIKSRATSDSSLDKKEADGAVDGPSLKMEPVHATKLSRSASQKATPRAAPLFDHLEDATTAARSSFLTMEACTYANKFLGYTEHAMECDCSEEWRRPTPLPAE